VKEFKNILLVSGSGRDCGKTTLACNIIRQLRNAGRVIGLKITPHFHITGIEQQLIEEGSGYKIFRETDIHSEKDSSRMLRAGATYVYFIQCEDGFLPGVYERLTELIPENYPVVCESGSFSSVYQSGFHVLIESENPDNLKKSYKLNLKKANLILSTNEFSITDVNYGFEYLDLQWEVNKYKLD